VALRILLPALLTEPGVAERFRAGARSLARINHPGVVVVYECVVDEPALAYWVMEYVEGYPLSRTLARVGRLTPAHTLDLVAQVADALQASHEADVVHGRVKPGHVLIRTDGTFVLFGFAVGRPPWDENVSPGGMVIGDTHYFSPEQALGEPATYLSDVFMLGIVIYQCLSGQRLFDGDNPLERALRLVRDPLPPLPIDIPSDVRALVHRALAKDPAARWPSGAAMAQAAREAGTNLGATRRWPA
jgi:serine/threonine-protein kinase